MKNNKSLGQHWLKNREILDEIADLAVMGNDFSKRLTRPGLSSAESLDEARTPAAERSHAPSPLCLEIGPGLGTLTSSLLKRFPKVIAVEYDAQLAVNLPKSFPGKNLRVINADILQANITELIENQEYVVVGNIPYYITSPIVRLLLTTTPRPQKIVLLMQKEVAERIAAEPGDHSLLSLFVQNQAEVELGPVVKAEEFTPPPKVDSQIIVLTPLAEPQVPAEALLLASRGFANPRKKLSANLADAQHSKSEWEEILQQCRINPAARAEDLDLWDWQELSIFVKNLEKS